MLPHFKTITVQNIRNYWSETLLANNDADNCWITTYRLPRSVGRRKVVDEDEEVEVLGGVDFTKYVDVVYITP